MDAHLIPQTPLGIYIERQTSGAYRFEMVSNGGLAVETPMSRISAADLATAYTVCLQKLSRAYGTLALDGDAPTPGRIVVPGKR